MKRQRTTLCLIRIYMILAILGILLWPLCSDLASFTGISSIIFAFLYSVTYTGKLGAILAILWGLIYAANMLLAYIVARRKSKYAWFLSVVGVDIMISVLCIVHKCVIDNQYGLTALIIGTMFRMIYFGALVLSVRISKKGQSHGS